MYLVDHKQGAANRQQTIVSPTLSAERARLEALVVDVWDRVLERGPAARTASILDLKVGVLRIHRLLRELAKATGVALPITAIFQAPTVASLVEVLRQRAAPPSEPLVLIRPGDGEPPPLFLFPGLGGMVLELLDLGRLIKHRGAIYAGLFRGLDGEQEPDRTVADLAAYQLAAVRSVQPHGPYLLAGHSLGGLVALELARLLSNAGEPVVFVALIEPNLPERTWPVSVRLAFLWRRVAQHVAAVRALSPRQAFDYVSTHIRPLFNRLLRLVGVGGRAASSPYHLEGLPAELAAVRAASLAAFYAYDIKPYAGKVTFLNSKGGDALSCDPLKVFPQFMREYDALVCSGDHATMLREPHVRQLAEQISTCLTELELSSDRFGGA